MHAIIFCVCLPGIMENSINCHGKVMDLYFQISVGTLDLVLYDIVIKIKLRYDCSLQSEHVYHAQLII